MITKEQSIIEITKHLNDSFTSQEQKEIIIDIFINNYNNSQVGRKINCSKEWIRQVKDKWVRSKRINKDRFKMLVSPFTRDFTFNNRKSPLNEEEQILLNLFINKNRIFEYVIQNNHIIDKKWMDYLILQSKQEMDTFGYAKINEFYIDESSQLYRGYMIKGYLGVINYLLIEKGCETIDVEEHLDLFQKLTKKVSARTIGSNLENKRKLLKIKYNMFRLLPTNYLEIFNEVVDTIEARPENEIGKELFSNITESLRKKYNFKHNELYYILNKIGLYSSFTVRSGYHFSEGNRMMISKKNSIKGVRETLKEKYGSGPALIDIQYSIHNLGFTKNTFINFDEVYLFNETKHLYFDDSIYPEITKFVLKALDSFKIDFISYKRLRSKLLDLTEGTKMQFVFAASSLTQILRRSMKNEKRYLLEGTRGNMNITRL